MSSTSKTQLEQTYKKVKKQNTDLANEYLKELNKNYNQKISDYKKQIEAQKLAVPRNYTDDYDLNAINRLINERKLKERMANLGLTNSGANKTFEIGLDIAKQNADNFVTMQKNRELQKLDAAYDNYYNKLDSELQSKRTETMKWLNDKSASLLSNLASKYNSSSSSNSVSNRVLSVYNKLVDMNSPSQQEFYIELVHEGGIITDKEAAHLKKKLGLD